MIHLFAGFEAREAIGFHVFVNSVVARCSEPVSIVPLPAMGQFEGSNAFTCSRFLVPYLMGFQGRAIFADASDMLVTADLAELAALADDRYAVQVVKHPTYRTRHRIKYRGTALETINTEYHRKNWASLMLINCAHPLWAGLTPSALAEVPVLSLLQFDRFPDELIGALPSCWNRLVDEGQAEQGAKLLHWTAGIPGFPAYHDAPGADLWHAERRAAQLELAA